MPDQLPDHLPQQSGIITQPYQTPWSALWWTTSVVTGLNAEAAGWHLAQGWRVTAIVPDNTTIPPTPYYSMTKESLNNAMVLQHLLNSFTIAQNDALANTEIRYNEVLANWMTLFGNTEDYLDTQADEQTGHVTIYLANLDTYMDNIEALVADNSAAIDVAVADVVPILEETAALMVGHDPVYDALVDSLLTDYEAYVTDFSAILDLLPGDYSDYATDFNSVLSLLPPDHESHAITATAFLDDLGMTERARINEEFAAKLAIELQQLTDRGLYSSVRAIDVTERNHRDRDEQIQMLHDRLMREQWDNQHKLYGQEQSVRDRTLSGKDRLHEQQVNMRGRMLSGTDGLYDRKVAMRTGTMQGKDRLYGLKHELLRYRIAQTLENAEAQLRHKHQAIAELMNVYAARLAGLQGKHAEDMELMKYMVNERNQLLVGLYGFVERRDDVAPQWESLAQMVAGLGDAGGGWISP